MWIFVSQMTTICRNHNPVLHSWFFRVCNKSTTMGVTSGTGTAYPKEAHEFTSGFCEIHVAQSSFLCSVLWIIICPLAFGHYMVCLSTNGLSVVLRYLKTVLTILILYICLYWIKVITKLPNSEQSYKGKVKTHNYINKNGNLHLKTVSLFEEFILLPTSMLLLLNSILLLMIYLHIF